MRYALSLELIGDDQAAFKRGMGFPADAFPGVRLIYSSGALGRYIRSRKDYTNANSVGSRGVVAYYELEGPAAYAVSDAVSWKRIEKYGLIVSTLGEGYRVSLDEAIKWASGLSDVMY